uniref:Uncharacterized protein n=1 Tax=Glossina pallidipes TaxID=7398 RepID=A0A1A9ZEV4_GLOPL
MKKVGQKLKILNEAHSVEIYLRFTPSFIRKKESRSKLQSTPSRSALRDPLKRLYEIEARPRPIDAFLYLQPTDINYRNNKGTVVDINLEHKIIRISKLTDFDTEDNVMHMETFSAEKPTFSLPIRRDGIGEIEIFGDLPLKLTLYESTMQESRDGTADFHVKPIEKVAVAQGYIDLMQYFFEGRNRMFAEVFLYPLNASFAGKICKVTWDIYSLTSLVKEVKFSNIIFIGFASLFNVDDQLLNNCGDLTAALSWQTKDSNKPTAKKKIFICKYTAFLKKIINEQNIFYKWETLKDPKYKNWESLGVNSEVNFAVHQLFRNVLGTENVDFNFADINVERDFALVCNSMHRFVLTDKNHTALEKHLAYDKQQIIVEIFKESEPNTKLLQGFLDVSVLLYPKVSNCSFAVELKAPLKSISAKSSQRNKTSNFEKSDEKITAKTTFAIIKVCLKCPLTEPPEDLNKVFNLLHVQRNIINDCWKGEATKPTISQNEEWKCEENYKLFDDNMRQIVRYLIEYNIKSISESKSYYCGQVKNVMDRILPLIACDFNIRCPTKTNIQFVNLMTTVFRELAERSYNLVQEVTRNILIGEHPTYASLEREIVQEINLAKLLYHIGNEEMSQHLFDELEGKYGDNRMYRFYMFLYDIEMENFDSAREYLKRPLKDTNMDGQLVTDICKLYLDYMRDKNIAGDVSNVTEHLLRALTHYCENAYCEFPIGWMILYCIYKKHNYRPGMSYTRWKYENLKDALFNEIKYIPKSRWEIFNNFEPKLKTQKGKFFWKACEFLLKLGLYYFALFLFDVIADELEEAERYIVDASFKLAVKLVTADFMPEDFSLGDNKHENFSNEDELNAFTCLVNGNIAYYNNPVGSTAMEYYASLLRINISNEDVRFQLGILRYAYRMLEKKQLPQALEAFEFAKERINDPLIAYVGKAKTLYYLDRLKEAELYFAESTLFGVHLPNVWAYLAAINVKLGDNYKALECWKYARLNPDCVINEEILSELGNLDVEEMALSQSARRVFLYLQPRSILYEQSADDVSSEIELNHPTITIMKLTDRYTSENIIQLEEFASEKPTFSVTIEQDNIRDINAFSDLPVTLTLYERHMPEKSSERMNQTNTSASQQYKTESRQPLLQGCIDMLKFFVNKRAKWSVDVILYPLKKEQKIDTCKMKWHIYALMPIIKDIKLSNAIYVTLASIFNANDNLLNDCNDLVATLSWQYKIPGKLEGFKKIFICKYTDFSKGIVGKDNESTFCKWENLKSKILQNYDSISVYTEMSLDITSALFSLARPEDTTFNFTKVDIETNYALVCNSLHRFILTDSMHNSLQNHLINSQLNVVLDIFKASMPNDILLQGFLDISILLYPNIKGSAFAVPMRRPEKRTSNPTIEKHNWSEPIPFAVIKICLKVPVTEPAEDVNIRFNIIDIETEIYNICRTSFTRSKRAPQYRGQKAYEKSYSEFDKVVLKIVDTYLRTNVHSKLRHEYSSCSIVSDTINGLLPLIACDFNVRFPTKTNVEFTLEKMYSKSPYFRFFMFIYDVEMGRYDSARDYLKRPSYIIDIEEEAFREFCCSLIEIYLEYEAHGIGAEENNSTADESLINALVEFCESSEPNSKIGWMLLYCAYKKYDYRPGMSYARFNYENVIKGGFFESMCLPKSRWEIFNNYKPKSQSEKFQCFWEPINFLLCLGLYQFAGWIFEEVADNCSEVERYILETSLKLHMGSIDEDFIPRNFFLNSEFNKAELEALVLLINGHAKHFLDPTDNSCHEDYYSGILNVTDLNNTYVYQVGIIRYAFRMGAEDEYEEAIRAFDFSGHYEEHRLITYMGKAKALYYLGRLTEAKDYFADLTNFHTYNPNTWCYLALINLQLGDRDNALECWKYAHLNPRMRVHDDVLQELEEINPDDVPL